MWSYRKVYPKREVTGYCSSQMISFFCDVLEQVRVIDVMFYNQVELERGF
jgi:hypothetical protein